MTVKEKMELLEVREQDNPEDDFVCGAEFKHNSTLNASSNIEVVEKIFVAKTSEKIEYYNKSIFELY